MLEVCVIIPSAAIGEVALSAVPLSLAGEDEPGLQPIGVGSKLCEENNSYLKHPGSPALRLTAREMTTERFGDAGKPGERSRKGLESLRRRRFLTLCGHSQTAL